MYQELRPVGPVSLKTPFLEDELFVEETIAEWEASLSALGAESPFERAFGEIPVFGGVPERYEVEAERENGESGAEIFREEGELATPSRSPFRIPEEVEVFAEADEDYTGDERPLRELPEPPQEQLDVPPTVSKGISDALSKKDWTRALELAIQEGWRDGYELTNLLFFERHPELGRRNLDPVKNKEDQELSKEWGRILNREVWPAIVRSAANSALATSGEDVTSGQRQFWDKDGKEFKARVEWAAKEVGLNPGLLAANLLAETGTRWDYLTNSKVSSYRIGVDDFYDRRSVLSRNVPAYSKVGWDRKQKPEVHLNDAQTKPRQVKTIRFNSGRDALLASAVYLKYGEVFLREEAKKLGGDFDSLPVETRFGLVRMAFAAGPGGARNRLIRALKGEDILVRVNRPLKAYQTDRNATVRAAQGLHLSDWIFGVPLAASIQPEKEFEDRIGLYEQQRWFHQDPEDYPTNDQGEEADLDDADLDVEEASEKEIQNEYISWQVPDEERSLQPNPEELEDLLLNELSESMIADQVVSSEIEQEDEEEEELENGSTAASGAAPKCYEIESSTGSLPAIRFEFDVNYGASTVCPPLQQPDKATVYSLEGKNITTHRISKDGFRLEGDGNRIEIATKQFELSEAGRSEMRRVIKNVLALVTDLIRQCAKAKLDTSLGYPPEIGSPRYIKPGYLETGVACVFPLTFNRTKGYYSNGCAQGTSPQVTFTLPLARIDELVTIIRGSETKKVAGRALSGPAGYRQGLRSKAIYDAQKAVNQSRMQHIKASTKLSNGDVVTSANFTPTLQGLLILIVSYLRASELPYNRSPDGARDYEDFAKAYLPLNVKNPFRLLYRDLTDNEKRVFKDLYDSPRTELWKLAKVGATAADGGNQLFPAFVGSHQGHWFDPIPTWNDLVELTITNKPLLRKKFDPQHAKKGEDLGCEVLFAPLSRIFPYRPGSRRVTVELRRLGFNWVLSHGYKKNDIEYPG